MTAIDLRDEDNPIDGQMYFCCSYISPKYVKNAVRVIQSKGKEKPEIDMEVVTAFKLRGVYPTLEEARERAKYLQSIDETHNIAIGTVGKWFVLDPDYSRATDITYYEDKLNQIMKAHDDEYQQIKRMEAERKKKNIEEMKENVKVNNEKVDINISKPLTDINEVINERENNKKILEGGIDKLEKLKKMIE